MTLVVAHRGAAQEAPQNSVQAFLDARRQGADGVELDVRRSRDGALVVNHDLDIPGKGPICDLDVADLPEHVALLSEAMVACGDLLVNVEIKNSIDEQGHDPSGALVSQVLAELAEILTDGQVIISSFDLATVAAVRREEPSMATGLLLEPGADVEVTADATLRYKVDFSEVMDPDKMAVAIKTDLDKQLGGSTLVNCGLLRRADAAHHWTCSAVRGDQRGSIVVSRDADGTFSWKVAE